MLAVEELPAYFFFSTFLFIQYVCLTLFCGSGPFPPPSPLECSGSPGVPLCPATAVVRKGFGEAGLVTALLSVLTSVDQELLLLATQAISRTAYDSSQSQTDFIPVIPSSAELL